MARLLSVTETASDCEFQMDSALKAISVVGGEGPLEDAMKNTRNIFHRLTFTRSYRRKFC